MHDECLATGSFTPKFEAKSFRTLHKTLHIMHISSGFGNEPIHFLGSAPRTYRNLQDYLQIMLHPNAYLRRLHRNCCCNTIIQHCHKYDILRVVPALISDKPPAIYIFFTNPTPCIILLCFHSNNDININS